MRKIQEVLRLSYEQGCSQREIAAATRMSNGSVGSTLRRAKAVGLTWELARELGDDELERQLYPSARVKQPPARVPLDFAEVHQQMRRKGMTLQPVRPWVPQCWVVGS